MPQATKACVQQELWAYVIELNAQKLTYDLSFKEGTQFGLWNQDMLLQKSENIKKWRLGFDILNKYPLAK